MPSIGKHDISQGIGKFSSFKECLGESKHIKVAPLAQF